MVDTAMTWAGSLGALAIMVVMALSGWLVRADTEAVSLPPR